MDAQSTSSKAKEPRIHLRDAEVNRVPFLYFVAKDVFDGRLADDLLAWLQGTATWNLHNGEFFEQYECDLMAADLPQRCSAVRDEAFLRELRRRLGEIFDVEFTDRVTIVAHKLTQGQGIGIHTDAPSDGLETHRLTVSLGKEFVDSMGGHLVFFASGDSGDVNRVFRPVHNAGVGFAMSERSYHAVSDVRQGERYSVVFSLWEKQVNGSSDLKISTDLLNFLRETKAGEIRHSGGTLLDHLTKTYAILKGWNVVTPVCVAGLFHSIYGTEGFRNAVISTGARKRVRDLVGGEAEKLAYLFSTISRRSLCESIRLNPPFSLPRHDGGTVMVSESELRGLLLIDLANSLEQLPRIEMPHDALREEWEFYECAAPFLPPAAVQDMRSAYEYQVSHA
ncbi:cyclophane-containing peptide 2OG-Fe(II) oxygenase YhhC [Streptomyces coeruleorubidus]|uniref:cyclophane-containing peptide 2OG-Fe(II) oxygenase YhhC n=1 Tax=Streptomyces coeruleorubidus TaxID=116188 RepID=UPI0033CF3118